VIFLFLDPELGLMSDKYKLSLESVLYSINNLNYKYKIK
jgi:hypothetical protein